jgi:mRNA interferase MazF
MTDIPSRRADARAQRVGAIVLTDFPFTDLSSTKRRQALVVSTGNARRDDVIVAYITSVLRNQPHAVPLEPTAGNGLKTPSLVRFDKIATLDKSIISGRLSNSNCPSATAKRLSMRC